MSAAIDWDLLKFNPADRVKLPPVPKTEKKALDFNQADHFLESSSEHWLSDYLILDMACGARRSEVLSLMWPDFEPDYFAVTIRRSLEQTRKSPMRLKETKGRNIRTVTLEPDAIEALKRIKARQEELRKITGVDYTLVFCHPDGSFIRPDSVTKAVKRLMRKAGFPGSSLHSVRHSNGSQMLSAGVPLAVVSKRLGHSSVYVTAQVYSHALESDEAAAAEKLGCRHAARQKTQGGGNPHPKAGVRSYA